MSVHNLIHIYGKFDGAIVFFCWPDIFKIEANRRNGLKSMRVLCARVYLLTCGIL